MDAASQLSLTVPISVPSAERMEEIYREECARAATVRSNWFDARGAANYLGESVRTFQRNWKKKYRLPRYEEGGIKQFWRADLDAHRLCKMVRNGALETDGKGVVIEFPSVAAHAALLKKGAA